MQFDLEADATVGDDSTAEKEHQEIQHSNVSSPVSLRSSLQLRHSVPQSPSSSQSSKVTKVTCGERIGRKV